MKVLIVDDSTTMLRIIKTTLNRIGITDVDMAEDGILAYALYSKSKYDLIITDWNMPNMNGLELVKKIRSIDQDTPIIMITTEGGKSSVITALKAGVNNYVVKPFTPQILKDKLSTIISV